MAWPPPSEVAVLEVNGTNYADWETVMVRHSRKTPTFTCRFTCSENSPIAKNWAALRIKPGDSCSVTLGGLLAFTGMIFVRQVYYDANRHHVELQGVGTSHVLTMANVTSPTMEWRKKTLSDFILEQLKTVNVKFKVVGGSMPDYKFPVIRVPHGTPMFEAIDRLSRGFNIEYTSDVNGSLVAIVGKVSGSDTVEEGKNILVGREIIFSEQIYKTMAQGSQPGTNKVDGAAAARQHHKEAPKGLTFAPSLFGGLPMQVLHAETPAWAGRLKGRVYAEQAYRSADEITVWATVYGWLKPTGGLWDINADVKVVSPMLIMDTELTPKSITFTQDNQTGTRTVLELCNLAALSKAGVQPQ